MWKLKERRLEPEPTVGRRSSVLAQVPHPRSKGASKVITSITPESRGCSFRGHVLRFLDSQGEDINRGSRQHSRTGAYAAYNTDKISTIKRPDTKLGRDNMTLFRVGQI
jgi:hypothetical protein